ncbi:MAG: hypothetical protein E7158_01375 [Firmicutes bacterium]|nr:hypothetical protein [Bacillota bacterium]
MRKSKILVVALVVLLTTGCGKETKLVCKQTASGVDVTFNIGFKGNEVKTMDFKYDMDLSDYTDKQIETVEKQDFCELVKSSMDEFSDAFKNCEKKVEDKHLFVTSDLEVDKIAKDEKDKMGSPEDTKKELEKQGYKCTEE